MTNIKDLETAYYDYVNTNGKNPSSVYLSIEDTIKIYGSDFKDITKPLNFKSFKAAFSQHELLVIPLTTTEQTYFL